jgi:hypothetical protein
MSFSSEEQDMLRIAVDRHFADLADEGFQIGPVSREYSPAAREHLVVECSRLDIGRGFKITLGRAPDGIRQGLSVFFWNGETGRFCFGLSSFLKSKGLSTGPVTLSAYEGSLPEQVDAVLCAVRATVDQYLLPALRGGEWPDVPIDWGDYR